MKTEKRNTTHKKEGLDIIRVKYTQRNIPIKVDIRSTDFDKAKLDADKYIAVGYQEAFSYLENHKNEAIYKEINDLSFLGPRLASLIKEFVELKKEQRANKNNDSSSLEKNIGSRLMSIHNQVLEGIKSNNSVKEKFEKMIDQKDRLKRNFYIILESDIQDNLNNQLNDSEKIINLINIIEKTINRIKRYDQKNEMANVLSSILSEIKTNNPGFFQNLNKVNERQENEESTYISLVKEIVNDEFWQGKAASRTGFNQTKIPAGITNIKNLLNNNQYNVEELHCKIKQIAKDKLNEVRSGFYNTRVILQKDENTIEFYKAICDDQLGNLELLREFKGKIHPVNSPSQSLDGKLKK